MPKTTEGKVLLRMYQLHQQGLKLQEIEDRLAEDFEESLVPDVSTISRRVRQYAILPPEELQENIAFSWSRMSAIPWEQSRLVLAMWADYETRRLNLLNGPFTGRLAKWTWRVLQAFGITWAKYIDAGYLIESSGEEGYLSTKLPDKNPGQEPLEDDIIGDVWQVTLEYTWREIASVVLNETFNTRDLDFGLPSHLGGVRTG